MIIGKLNNTEAIIVATLDDSKDINSDEPQPIR